MVTHPLDPKDIINRVRVCSWRYNDILPQGNKLHYGVIAQDVLQSFGNEYNFVDQSGTYLKVNYHEFIGPLISYAQQLQERIEQQDQRITNLEKIINTITHKEYT